MWKADTSPDYPLQAVHSGIFANIETPYKSDGALSFYSAFTGNGNIVSMVRIAASMIKRFHDCSTTPRWSNPPSMTSTFDSTLSLRGSCLAFSFAADQEAIIIKGDKNLLAPSGSEILHADRLARMDRPSSEPMVLFAFDILQLIIQLNHQAASSPK